MRFAVFFASILAAAAVLAGASWWVDPFNARYHPEYLAQALSHQPPCYISLDLIPIEAAPDYKLELVRRTHSRVVAVGTSRVGQLHRRPGEPFTNLNVPGTGADSLPALFDRLAAAAPGPLVVYLSVDELWFVDGWRTDVTWREGLRSRLKELLSAETLGGMLRAAWERPGVLLHGAGSSGAEVTRIGRGCILDSRSVRGARSPSSWNVDGTWELRHQLAPTEAGLPEAKARGQAQVKALAFRADRMKPLAAALAQARRRGWLVVGFLAPDNPQFAGLERSPAYVALHRRLTASAGKLFAREGYPWVDLQDARRVPCSASLFLPNDLVHFGAECSRRVRAILDRAAAAARG